MFLLGFRPESPLHLPDGVELPVLSKMYPQLLHDPLIVYEVVWVADLDTLRALIPLFRVDVDTCGEKSVAAALIGSDLN